MSTLNQIFKTYQSIVSMDALIEKKTNEKFELCKKLYTELKPLALQEKKTVTNIFEIVLITNGIDQAQAKTTAKRFYNDYFYRFTMLDNKQVDFSNMVSLREVIDTIKTLNEAKALEIDTKEKSISEIKARVIETKASNSAPKVKKSEFQKVMELIEKLSIEEQRQVLDALTVSISKFENAVSVNESIVSVN